MDKEELVHMPSGILLNHKRNELMPFGVTWIAGSRREELHLWQRS